MGGGEPAGGGVDDHRDLAGRLVEAVLEAQPQVLERVERALRARGVVALVAGGEAERLGLDPGHRGASLVDRAGGGSAVALDLDDLLEGRAVDPVDRRLGDRAGRRCGSTASKHHCASPPSQRRRSG